jgi:GNAT superfamily N-acetyltransferase
VDGARVYEVERLTEPDAATVDAINALIPQLKPSWAAITATHLAVLVASDSRVYVARESGRVIGLTVMVPHRHLPGLRFHVEDVVVDVDHRGKGVGRRLLEHAMDDAPGEVVSFDLRSQAARRAAHRLYRSLGFEPSDTTVLRLPR